MAEKLESITDDARREIIEDACADCDRGCCDDCEAYGDGEFDGYRRGFEDAVLKRDHEYSLDSWEATAMDILQKKLSEEAEAADEETE